MTNSAVPASDSAPRSQPRVAAERSDLRSRTVFFFLTAGLAVLGVVWVVQNELIHSNLLLATAVPTIPALAALLVITAFAVFVWPRARAGIPLSVRGWILGGYTLIVIATAVTSVDGLALFYAYLTLPQYLAASQEEMAHIAAQFPRWYAPPPSEAVRRFYDGGGTGAVPWNVWLGPLAAWGGFLAILLLTLYAALVLLRRSWMEAERLSYPIAQIPLRLLGEQSRGVPPFWRDPLMWLGFALAASYDGINMLQAFLPSMPSMGVGFDIGLWFPSKPWSALSPLRVSYRPEIFGLAYLMPTEVLLTAWVSYLALRLSTVIRVASGEQIASTAYDYREIATGAFVCLFALLIWRAQPDLSRSLKEALGWRRGQSANEPLSPRVAWSLLILGAGAMTAWLHAAGLPLWLAFSYLSLILAVALVYARMRAETGAPMYCLFPWWEQQHVLFNFLGSQALSGGSARALTIFASIGCLSWSSYPSICAYSAEGMSLAGRARFPQRRVTLFVVAGILLGLGLGGYLHLTANYRYGANVLDGGTGQGGYHVAAATEQYTALIRMLETPAPPKGDHIAETFVGCGITLALNLLRQCLFWFPLHPMGFAMASAYGFHLWAPFLAVWVLKTLIFRFSGNAGYRRFVPLFLGIALGRYLFAGLVWGVLGATGHPATATYVIQFG